MALVNVPSPVLRKMKICADLCCAWVAEGIGGMLTGNEAGEKVWGTGLGYVEESDVVARSVVRTTAATATGAKSVRLGIVSEVFADQESSDEDDTASDAEGKLKPGTARVEWYPSGKVSKG